MSHALFDRVFVVRIGRREEFNRQGEGEAEQAEHPDRHDGRGYDEHAEPLYC